MKKITFKSLSILLALVLLVTALPVAAFAEDVSPCADLPCEHNFTTRHTTSYVPISETEHITTHYTIENCIWCGENSISNDAPYFESHDFIENSYVGYVYINNEYHITTEYTVKVCQMCKERYINESSKQEWHEFDDSVDPEVDMEGVCTCCGGEISW